MRRGTSVLAALAMAAGLAACAGGPEVQQSNPSDVELYWYNGQNGLGAAQAEAQGHCQSWGRKAVLVQEFTDRDVTRARFACR